MIDQAIFMSVKPVTRGSIENANMYTRYAGCGRTVLGYGVVTSYLNGLTLPTKRSVHLHRYICA